MHPPDLVILDLILPDIDGLDVCTALRNDPHTATAIIVMLTSRDRPEEISAGLQAGADDYIVKQPGAAIELEEKLPVWLTETKATRMMGRGRMISFFSAKGGTGTSVLCVNLAYALSDLVAPKTVLVADMVLPVGSIASMVGADVMTTVVRLTQEERRPTRPTIGRYSVPLDQWGFRVLVGAKDPIEAQALRVDRVPMVFETLRASFDYLCVDFGRGLSRITIPLLQTSEAIVLILGPDLNTVHLSKIVLNFLRKSGVADAQLFPVLNRAVGREGLTKTQIEQELNLEIRGTIPYAHNNFTLAINQNLPYATRFSGDTTTMILNDLAVQLRERVDHMIPR
jgi:pilus assembly protein CpaE